MNDLQITDYLLFIQYLFLFNSLQLLLLLLLCLVPLLLLLPTLDVYVCIDHDATNVGLYSCSVFA